MWTFIASPLLLLTVIGVVFYAIERSSNLYVRRFTPVPIILTAMVATVLVLLPHAKLAGLTRLEILWRVALPTAVAPALLMLEAFWLARVLARRWGARVVPYLGTFVVAGAVSWAITVWIGMMVFVFIGY